MRDQKAKQYQKGCLSAKCKKYEYIFLCVQKREEERVLQIDTNQEFLSQKTRLGISKGEETTETIWSHVCDRNRRDPQSYRLNGFPTAKLP